MGLVVGLLAAHERCVGRHENVNCFDEGFTLDGYLKAKMIPGCVRLHLLAIPNEINIDPPSDESDVMDTDKSDVPDLPAAGKRSKSEISYEKLTPSGEVIKKRDVSCYSIHIGSTMKMNRYMCIYLFTSSTLYMYIVYKNKILPVIYIFFWHQIQMKLKV